MTNNDSILLGSDFHFFKAILAFMAAVLALQYIWILATQSFTHELRSSKYNNLILDLSSRCIVVALHYVVKSAIFETATFALASIVGYLVVYRWFRR